ncbi:MAG TPA: DUF2680 domain-containing protein [Bacillota bacterium]|nr:DUF2680 domain-containing protein [Bacillota bacterium]
MVKSRKTWLCAVLVVVVLAIALPVIVQAQETTAPSRVEEIQEQILALRRELVQELLRTGGITAEQAERMLDRLNRIPDREGFRPGRGPGRGWRGCPCSP